MSGPFAGAGADAGPGGPSGTGTGESDAAVVSGGGPLRGRARVPGDKSISHRALLLAGIASGRSRVLGLSRGDDVARTAAALAAYGIEVEELGAPPAPTAGSGDRSGTGAGTPGRDVLVHGRASDLLEPERPIDVGNSGTGLRLLTGFAARSEVLSVLVGDASIHRRPMERVVSPLRAMGARIDGRDSGRLAPLVVRGGALRGIDYAPEVSSAQVKSAVLLAGLAATGETVVRERVATRRHTEELLVLAGADVDVDDAASGYAARVRASQLRGFDLEVPGDPSQAAFLVVAACVVPGSEVVVERVYVGPGRAGFVGVLRRMGADIELVHHDATTADIVARHSTLHATTVQGAEVPDCIDEIPVLAVAASFASGTTVFADAAELRVKESDRIETTSSELARLGVDARPTADGLVVTGGRVRPAGPARSHGDHRIAMALAVATLGAGDGARLEIGDFSSVATSWPGFLDVIESLR